MTNIHFLYVRTNDWCQQHNVVMVGFCRSGRDLVLRDFCEVVKGKFLFIFHYLADKFPKVKSQVGKVLDEYRSHGMFYHEEVVPQLEVMFKTIVILMGYDTSAFHIYKTEAEIEGIKNSLKSQIIQVDEGQEEEVSEIFAEDLSMIEGDFPKALWFSAPALPLVDSPLASAPPVDMQAAMELLTSTAPVPPVETVPVQTAPVETVPVETVPVETAPVETVPVETAPVETVPVETAPVQTAPVETVPVETVPVKTAPVKTAVPVPPADDDGMDCMENLVQDLEKNHYTIKPRTLGSYGLSLPPLPPRNPKSSVSVSSHRPVRMATKCQSCNTVNTTMWRPIGDGNEVLCDNCHQATKIQEKLLLKLGSDDAVEKYVSDVEKFKEDMLKPEPPAHDVAKFGEIEQVNLVSDEEVNLVSDEEDRERKSVRRSSRHSSRHNSDREEDDDEPPKRKRPAPRKQPTRKKARLLSKEEMKTAPVRKVRSRVVSYQADLGRGGFVVEEDEEDDDDDDE